MATNKDLKLYLIILGLLVSLSGFGYHFALQLQPEFLSLLYVALLYMPTPFYALLVTSKIRNRPLMLRQYGTPSGLTVPGVATTVALFVAWIVIFSIGTWLLSHLVPDAVGQFAASSSEVKQNIAEAFGPEAAASANLPGNIVFMISTAFIAAVVSGFSINLLFALGEEYGWRGYLNQWLKFNFLKRHLIIGALWGLWHAPLILQGYNYGNDYRLVGAGLFVVFTITLGMILAWLVERFGNILYSAAFHGMFNGFVGIFPFLLGSYHPLIGGPVGIIAAISFAALLPFVRFMRPVESRKT